MTGATLGALMGLVSALAGGSLVGLFAFAVPLLVAALIGIPFALDAKKSETLLREIFATAPGTLEAGAYRS